MTVNTTLQFDAHYDNNGKLVSYNVHGVVGGGLDDQEEALANRVAQMILQCGQQVESSGTFTDGETT